MPTISFTPRQIFALVGVVILLVYIGYLKYDIHKLTKANTELTASNVILTQNNMSLTKAIQKQNQAVDQLATVEKTIVVASTAHAASVVAKTEQMKKHADSIANSSAPTSCDESIKYLIEAVPEYITK